MKVYRWMLTVLARPFYWCLFGPVKIWQFLVGHCCFLAMLSLMPENVALVALISEMAVIIFSPAALLLLLLDVEHGRIHTGLRNTENTNSEG